MDRHGILSILITGRTTGPLSWKKIDNVLIYDLFGWEQEKKSHECPLAGGRASSNPKNITAALKKSGVKSLLIQCEIPSSNGGSLLQPREGEVRPTLTHPESEAMGCSKGPPPHPKNVLGVTRRTPGSPPCPGVGVPAPPFSGWGGGYRHEKEACMVVEGGRGPRGGGGIGKSGWLTP